MQAVPHDPKRTKNTIGCIAIAILVTILSVTSAYFLRVPSPPKVASETDACLMAQKFVKEQLKAPSTAKFADCHPPDTTITQVNRVWKVNSWVDAQNSFGAMIRNEYTIDLVYYSATETWSSTNLNISSR